MDRRQFLSLAGLLELAGAGALHGRRCARAIAIDDVYYNPESLL